MVVVTFDNGARAVAEASFSAGYGYDVRGEVFGSGGMVTVGDGAPHRDGAARRDRPAPADRPRRRRADADAYTAELAEFADAVREGRSPSVTGVDARRALSVAVACIESVQRGGAVRLDPVTGEVR